MAASNCSRNELRIVEDETLTWYHPDDDPNVAYGFCARCGSSLFWKVVNGPPDQLERISICAGTLDQPTELNTEKVLFAEEIADYHVLAPEAEILERQ